MKRTSLIEQPGIIERIEGHDAWVVPQTTSGCGQCVSKSSCGTSVIAGFLARRRRSIRVANTAHWAVGDPVTLQISEQAFMKGVGIGYGVPLIAMLTGSFVLQQVAQWIDYSMGDGPAMAGALAGLVGGLLWVRHHASTTDVTAVVAQTVVRLN